MPTPVDPGRPVLVAGPGSIGRLPEVLSWWRPERVLLVGSRAGGGHLVHARPAR